MMKEMILEQFLKIVDKTVDLFAILYTMYCSLILPFFPHVSNDKKWKVDKTVFSKKADNTGSTK